MRLLLACTCLALLAGPDQTGIADLATPALASVIVSEPGTAPRLLESGSRAFGGFELGSVRTVQDDPALGESGVTPAGTERRELSRDEICDTLASAAQSNDLPPKFFMRLIWQESKLNPKAVSPAGAQGVAQFMPRIAAAFGISDPFDPAQALPASARFLKSLLNQFGNLGLAAAAYNGGSRGTAEKDESESCAAAKHDRRSAFLSRACQ